jgi:hypothetical protein
MCLPYAVFMPFLFAFLVIWHAMPCGIAAGFIDREVGR